MSARIRTSEPAYRAPVSQWQRERMGPVLPEHPVTRHNRVEIALTMLIFLAVSTFFFVKVFS